MRRLILVKIIVSVIVGSLLISCGPSPLWHHRKEVVAGQSSQNPEVEKKPESPSNGDSGDGTSSPPQIVQCGFDWGADECWELQWINGPNLKKESFFRLQLKNRKTGNLLPADLAPEIDLWMPDMNHGSAPVTLTRESDSSFTVSKVYLIMRGHWQIRLKNGQDVLATYQLVLP